MTLVKFNASALQVIRELSGFSLAGLAKATGIDRASLHRFETGERPGTARQINQVAEVLGVPVPAIATFDVKAA